MTNVRCSNIKCKFIDEKSYKCNNKNINLSFNCVNTVNQGYQDYLKCNSFELSQDYVNLENKVKHAMNIVNHNKE